MIILILLSFVGARAGIGSGHENSKSLGRNPPVEETTFFPLVAFLFMLEQRSPLSVFPSAAAVVLRGTFATWKGRKKFDKKGPASSFENRSTASVPKMAFWPSSFSAVAASGNVTSVETWTFSSFPSSSGRHRTIDHYTKVSANKEKKKKPVAYARKIHRIRPLLLN